MQEVTRQQLLELDRAFYNQVAPSFDQTRQTAWPGWQQAWKLIQPRLKSNPSQLPLRLLDLGCGNGRWGAFVANQLPSSWLTETSYIGVDENAFLLQLAARRLLTTFAQLQLHNVSVDAFLEGREHMTTAGQQPIPIVTLYGVWHHLPGEAYRQTLLQKISQLLSPQGLLVISCWRFLRSEALAARAVPASTIGINDDLDPGDYILDWRSGARAYRYCHDTDDAEMTKLATRAGVRIIDRWTADGRNGRLNDYYLISCC